MSGGHFNYEDSSLQSTMFGYGQSWSNVFEDREISELVWDVLNLIHDYDWYISGDTDKTDYKKAVTNFKSKWLRDTEKNRDRIINDAVDSLRAELLETFCQSGDT